MPQRSLRTPQELDDLIWAEARRQDRSWAYIVLRAVEQALGSVGGESAGSVSERPEEAVSSPVARQRASERVKEDLPASRPAPAEEPVQKQPQSRADMFRAATQRRK